eukprot:1136596-Pelagomonas_calceolata.AAC.2
MHAMYDLYISGRRRGGGAQGWGLCDSVSSDVCSGFCLTLYVTRSMSCSQNSLQPVGLMSTYGLVGCTSENEQSLLWVGIGQARSAWLQIQANAVGVQVSFVAEGIYGSSEPMFLLFVLDVGRVASAYVVFLNIKMTPNGDDKDKSKRIKQIGQAKETTRGGSTLQIPTSPF